MLFSMAFFTSSLSVKFTASGRNTSVVLPISAVSNSGFRVVATTRQPFCNNFFTKVSPKPFDAPVTNHTFFASIFLLFFVKSDDAKIGRYKMSGVAISMNGVVKSWVGFIGRVSFSLATNGSGIAEGGEIEAQKFNLVPQLAIPLFYLLIYIFKVNKKWFLRNRSTNVEF